jgi:hypothetical protein
MTRDFFDPTPEQQNVVLIDAAILHKAQRLIESCEHCNPEGPEIPFDNILDRVTGSDPSVTDYVLETPAKCPTLLSRDHRKDIGGAHVIPRTWFRASLRAAGPNVTDWERVKLPYA